MNSIGLMENAAPVEILKNADFHSGLEKLSRNQVSFSTFPTGPGGFVLVRPLKGKALVGGWNRRSSARLRKENPRLGNVVWKTRIHEQRVRQLPMNQLSCVRIDPRISD
jgi:hypothetical protein